MRNQGVMDEYLSRVAENPRSEQFDENGNMFVPEVDHETIIDWLKEMAPKHRVLVVDPISQIDGKGRETWTEESWFIRQALGIVSTYGISLILVTHTVKRSGVSGLMAPTAEDVQGSSMFTKLAHVTLIIDACDMQEGEIYGIGGTTRTVNYDRVVTIAAARNGKGTRWRVAYTQDKEKPIFHELGLLVPTAKRKGVK